MSEELHELVSRYVLGSSFRYEGPEAQARPSGCEQTKEERDDAQYRHARLRDAQSIGVPIMTFGQWLDSVIGSVACGGRRR